MATLCNVGTNNYGKRKYIYFKSYCKYYLNTTVAHCFSFKSLL